MLEGIRRCGSNQYIIAGLASHWYRLYLRFPDSYEKQVKANADLEPNVRKRLGVLIERMLKDNRLHLRSISPRLNANGENLNSSVRIFNNDNEFPATTLILSSASFEKASIFPIHRGLYNNIAIWQIQVNK